MRRYWPDRKGDEGKAPGFGTHPKQGLLTVIQSVIGSFCPQ